LKDTALLKTCLLIMQSDAVLKKLRVPLNENLLIMNAPTQFSAMINHLPYDTNPVPKKNGTYDFVAVFGANQAELRQNLSAVKEAGKYDCLFWACYPKGTGQIKSDLKREIVWDAVQTIGLRCVTQVAIDDTWSALRGRPHAAVGS
jgi:hypothetical protein